jgi:hypothetical protein
MPPASRPTICLNMIVRDEAHIICEALDSAAPHIDRWVIVDTGSTDDTVATIERRMAEHGVPGEIHHRPWRDFGSNRTEAIGLATGQADYLWILDADDLVTGALDLTGLVADSYLLRYRVGHAFWRRQIFRSGLPWRYVGVLHEYPTCDAPATEARLEGAYEVHGRTLGARSTDPQKYLRDAALLRTVLEHDPEDARALFYLGQSLADGGDDEGALDAFSRRAALGDWDEEHCIALIRRGDCLMRLGRPWEEALQSYLDAFDARPTRAEPFARIARHCREAGRFEDGYEYARRAADMAYPTADYLFVDDGVYGWGARDEQAVCAFSLGRYEEALDLGTALLAGSALPDGERERVAANRDSCVAHVSEARSSYPARIVEELTARSGGSAPASADVTVTIVARGDLGALARTLNSLLQCVEDLERVARWVCLTGPIDPAEARALIASYPFLELVRDEASSTAIAPSLNRLLVLVHTPFWLHLEPGWELFARGRHLDRAERILVSDPAIAQVAFNRSYAVALEERTLAGGEVRTADDLRFRLHEYVVPQGPAWEQVLADLGPGARTNRHWPHFTVQPSLMDVELLRAVGPFVATGDSEHEFGERYTALGLRTAFFDEVTSLRRVPSIAAPVLLTSLAAGSRIGELILDVDPPWPVLSAAVVEDSGSARLTVRTGLEDEAPLDFEVALGPEFEIETVRAVDTEQPVHGPLTLAVEGMKLSLEALAGGGLRLLLHRDGEAARASAPFTLAGADEERPFGLAWVGGRLLIVFGLFGERLAIAVLDRKTTFNLFEK